MWRRVKMSMLISVLGVCLFSSMVPTRGQTDSAKEVKNTACPGEHATGSPPGPDLTSKKWMWSDGSYAGITKVIREGVPQPKEYRSPMPPMGGAQLTPEQLSAPAAYVWALSH